MCVWGGIFSSLQELYIHSSPPLNYYDITLTIGQMGFPLQSNRKSQFEIVLEKEHYLIIELHIFDLNIYGERDRESLVFCHLSNEGRLISKSR